MEITQGLVIAFFLFLICSAFIKKWRSSNWTEFILAGRKLTLFPFVATLVATSYGWILGVSEVYFHNGAFAWFFLSFPYLIFNLIFAFFFSKRTRAAGFESYPDLLRINYGSKVSFIGALGILILMAPSMYILMTAQLINWLFNWNIYLSIVISTILSVVYVFFGGLKAITKNDIIKFILMFLGFGLLTIILWKDYGLSYLINNSDPKDLSFNIKDFSSGFLTWLLLASIVLVDPSYHQRIYSVDNPKTAKKGMIWAVVLWSIFDFFTLSTALFGKAILNNPSPNLLYPELGTFILPDYLEPLFFLGIFATIMSTTDSFLFISALGLSNDILLKNKINFGLSNEKLARWSILLISILSLIIAVFYANKTALSLFLDFTPVICSALVIPTIFSWSKRFKLSGNLVFIQMLLSAFFCIITQLFPFKIGGILIPSIWIGMLISMITQLVFIILLKAKK